MPRLSVLIIAAALSGCAGIDYLSKNYSDAKLIPVETADGKWNVVDKPDQGKILVQRGLAEAMVQGFTGGLILNPTATAMPRPYYEKAANTYVANGGKACRVKDGFLVVEPTWEFTYECEAAPVVTGTLPKKGTPK